MLDFLIGTKKTLSASLVDSLSRYRHEVFIRGLGWNLPGLARDSERELDQFDTEETRYVMAVGSDGNICGCARLLPTTRPYLLKDVFHYLSDLPLPETDAVWELSRFAAVRPRQGEARSSPQHDLARMVFERAVAVAADLGATQIVGVLSLEVERTCHRFGAPLVRLGSVQWSNGQSIVACKLDTCYLNARVRGVPASWQAAVAIDAGLHVEAR